MFWGDSVNQAFCFLIGRLWNGSISQQKIQERRREEQDQREGKRKWSSVYVIIYVMACIWLHGLAVFLVRRRRRCCCCCVCVCVCVCTFEREREREREREAEGGREPLVTCNFVPLSTYNHFQFPCILFMFSLLFSFPIRPPDNLWIISAFITGRGKTEAKGNGIYEKRSKKK